MLGDALVDRFRIVQNDAFVASQFTLPLSFYVGRLNLYFERFLNEERGDVPDIDIDICGARRDELLEWVYQRWGAEHVAMISSFVTMHARLAVREVAKVFGLSTTEVNHFTARLPHRPVRDIAPVTPIMTIFRPGKPKWWAAYMALSL